MYPITKRGRWTALSTLPGPVGAVGTGPSLAAALPLTGTELNIRDYGAAIDGATDDAAAVAAAVAAASPGATVLHPGGTSMISDTTDIPSDVTLAGVGDSVFKALPGLSGKFMFEMLGVDLVSDVDDVTVRDLTFDLDNVSQAAALRYRNTNRLLVDRCHFSNSSWYYIHESSSYLDGLAPLATDITVRDCIFDSHTGTSRECLIAAYVTGFVLERCRFENTNLGFSIYRAAFDTIVRDCEFISVVGPLPNAVLYGRGCDGVLVTNCYFEAAGSLSQSAIRGCQPGSDYIVNGGLLVDPNYPTYIQDVAVTNCTFVNCGTPVQVGAVVGFTDRANVYDHSLGTAVLVNSGVTNAEFLGYASRSLNFYGSLYDSNMQTGGTAAVFFNSTQAGINLQMIARRNVFTDHGVKQTRAFAFAGNNVPAESIFAGASIDTTNTANVQVIRLLSSATGVTLEVAAPAIESFGAYVPNIAKRGLHRPTLRSP